MKYFKFINIFFLQAITIVLTVQTKIQVFVINEIVILIHNFSVKTVNVFRNCGIAILMMIVETILMNQLTYVAIVIAQQAGKNVHQDIIIVAFQAGSSVTVKTIVVIIRMKLIQICVLNAQVPVTSSAKTIAVFLSDGVAVSFLFFIIFTKNSFFIFRF